MKKEKEPKDNHSLRTFVIYGSIVVLIISIALLLRFITIVKESKFDGQHRFTIALAEKNNVFGIISLEPLTGSVAFLTFDNDASIPAYEVNQKIGIIPDALINADYKLSHKDTAPSILRSLLLNTGSITQNITIVDLFRLWFYADRTPGSTIINQKISIKSEREFFYKKSALLFSDSNLSAENISIQIVNASGVSGLGGRLERVISNLGGNVVSIKTASQNEHKSRIKYFDDTYTLKKIGSLLSFKQEKMDKQAIAEIIIIIGEDQVKTNLF